MSTPTNFYNLRYLGYAGISKFTPGLTVIQKPLHDLYVTYLTSKGPKMLIVSRLALTDRGIILTANGKDSFYSMRDILLWEPVQWVYVQTKDKKIMSAFEPMNPDRHLGQEGLFSRLDGQYKYLAQLKHDPLLTIALKKSSDAKQIEVHAFVCDSDAHVFEVAQSLWRAEQVYLVQEAKGIGCSNSPPPGQVQGQPKSVRGSVSGSRLLLQEEKRGKQSTRQGKGRKVEGEITLEELIRLADQALADPTGNGAAAANQPPFKMGEAWVPKDNKGVQRSRTFNDGLIGNREHGNEEARRGVNNNQSHPVPFYENAAAPLKPTQQRTYENVSNNSTPSNDLLQPEASSEGHQQLPVPAERRISSQIDPKRLNIQPESLRAVIVDSKRASVLPGTELTNAGNIDDDDDALVPNQSKPVALVQPRKVPRYKVLPEGLPEAVLLNHKVPQNKNQGKNEPQKEQYQMGVGDNYTRSMYELNNIAPKTVTPQPQRRGNNPDVDPTKKMINSDLNLARKSSNPESSNRNGGNRVEERKKPEKVKKEAEMEALAMSANFERPPVNTLSPHGTNFENALGYFP